MKITGYGTPTEKEDNYPTIRRILQEHEFPTSEIDNLIDDLREGVRFRLVIDEPTYTLILDELPKSTTCLLIETE